MDLPSVGSWLLHRETGLIGQVTMSDPLHAPIACADAHGPVARCGRVRVEFEDDFGPMGAVEGQWPTADDVYTLLLDADHVAAVRHLIDEVSLLAARVRYLRRVIQEIAHPTMKENAR